MEGYQMTQEQQEILLRLSAVVMENEKREADAVKGYTEQVNVIREARLLFSENEEVLSELDALEDATEEKIQDELNHGLSLYREFTQMTGIEPAKE